MNATLPLLAKIQNFRGRLFHAGRFSYHFYHVIIVLSSWSAKLLTHTSHTLVYTIDYFAQIGLIVLALLAIILSINFVKSIQPRFRLISPSFHEECLNPRHSVKTNKRRASKLSVDSLFDTELISLNNVRGLTKSSLEAVYKRLSWSDTQLDLENVLWINHTIQTFWPSISTIARKICLKNLPQTNRPVFKNKDAQSLAPKLSIYLTCRRKLDLIRKARALRAQATRDTLIVRGLELIGYSIKILILYAKQFVIDHVSWLLKCLPASQQTDVDNSSGRAKIELRELVKKHVIPVTCRSSLDDSPGDRPVRKAAEKAGERDAKGKINSRTKFESPSKDMKRLNIQSNNLLSSTSWAKLRAKRSKLARKINRASETINSHRKITIKELNLGNSYPVLTGVKYIGSGNNHLLSTAYRLDKRISASDEKRMKLLIELSYMSDRDFFILIKSVPIFKRLLISRFDFNIRLLLTIHHTNIEHNQNLELFNVPDDIMFPMINSAQITLVDTPQIDWHLKRPKSKRAHNKVSGVDSLLSTSSKKQGRVSIKRTLLHILNPIILINHPLSKYLMHQIIYLTQRWFQPFDIVVGKQFHLKTLY